MYTLSLWKQRHIYSSRNSKHERLYQSYNKSQVRRCPEWRKLWTILRFPRREIYDAERYEFHANLLTQQSGVWERQAHGIKLETASTHKIRPPPAGAVLAEQRFGISHAGTANCLLQKIYRVRSSSLTQETSSFHESRLSRVLLKLHKKSHEWIFSSFKTPATGREARMQEGSRRHHNFAAFRSKHLSPNTIKQNLALKPIKEYGFYS
jgi:hypothetical protein